MIMSRKQDKSRADIYARITDRIVADLERGVRPWTRPWTVPAPIYATLIEVEGQEGLQLIWSRPNRD